MKILVTGANGFVGTEVVRQLLDDRHTVVAVDSLRYGPWRVPTAAQREELDLRDVGAVRALMSRIEPEAIIHLAAVHFIPECERAPGETISLNVQATVNVLSECPTSCRVVFASTAAVYAPDDGALTEDSLIGPLDVYGWSKLAAEHFVQHFSQSRELETVIVRLFNVIGPGETNPHVLPEIIAQLRAGERALRLGNTAPRRDYIYVADAARGFIAAATLALEAAGSPFIVNLGTGTAHSVEQIVAELSTIVGDDIAITVDPTRVRAVDRQLLLADNTRMQQTFAWQREHDLVSSLRATWAESARPAVR